MLPRQFQNLAADQLFRFFAEGCCECLIAQSNAAFPIDGQQSFGKCIERLTHSARHRFRRIQLFENFSQVQIPAQQAQAGDESDQSNPGIVSKLKPEIAVQRSESNLKRAPFSLSILQRYINLRIRRMVCHCVDPVNGMVRDIDHQFAVDFANTG